MQKFLVVNNHWGLQPFETHRLLHHDHGVWGPGTDDIHVVPSNLHFVSTAHGSSNITVDCFRIQVKCSCCIASAKMTLLMKHNWRMSWKI